MDNISSWKFIWQIARWQTFETFMLHNCIIDHKSMEVILDLQRYGHFLQSQDNPGCQILNMLKVMDVSCRGIAPNWGAIKQPAKKKAIND